MPHVVVTLRAADFSQVRRAADLCEGAGLDALALAPGREPTALLAALAAVTDRLGLIASVRTDETEPYHLARTLASLDHLSRGRAGWHIPTGEPRTAEYVEVVTSLWDSFDDDAFTHDQASGVYFHPDRLHTLDHAGEHLSVAGPLNIARPPQGHPPILLPDGTLADAPHRVFRPLDPAVPAGSDHLVAVSDVDELAAFVREVLPALREGAPPVVGAATLRDRLDLPRPRSSTHSRPVGIIPG